MLADVTVTSRNHAGGDGLWQTMQNYYVIDDRGNCCFQWAAVLSIRQIFYKFTLLELLAKVPDVSFPHCF